MRKDTLFRLVDSGLRNDLIRIASNPGRLTLARHYLVLFSCVGLLVFPFLIS